jgi:hypothetical protein
MRLISIPITIVIAVASSATMIAQRTRAARRLPRFTTGSSQKVVEPDHLRAGDGLGGVVTQAWCPAHFLRSINSQAWRAAGT